MIVICTKCQAKFRVADEKIGPRGAKVRCSKCQTVFVVRPEPPAEVAPAPASRTAGAASTGDAPSGRTTNTVWHLEQRTFAPRGPIFSSGTRNFAWHFVQVTIIRIRSGIRDYTPPRLTPSGKDRNNAPKSRTYLRPGPTR